MSQVEALARKVGFGFRPDEKVPTDPVQWINDQLQLPRSFQGISSLSDPGQIGEWAKAAESRGLSAESCKLFLK